MGDGVDLDDAGIGRRLTTHPVDSWARWWGGLTGVLMVVLGVSGTVALAIVPHWGKNGGSWPSPASVLSGLAVLATGLGLALVAVQFPRALRGGWREVFQIHKGGLAHRGWRPRSWTWAEIATIRRWTPGHCEVRFADGARVRVDKTVLDSQRLMTTLVTRRPDAVDPTPPFWYRHAPALLWPAFALFLCASVGLFWYLYELGSGPDLAIVAAGVSGLGLMATITLLGMWALRRRS